MRRLASRAQARFRARVHRPFPPTITSIGRSNAALLAVAGIALVVATLPALVPFEDACTLHLDASRPSPIQPPSAHFLLGTDPLGRSEALRLAYAVRTSLALAVPATLASCAAGIVLGSLAGAAASKRSSSAFSELADVFALFTFDVLLAVPFVLVVACAAALVDGVSPASVVAIMTLASTPAVAKVARARVLGAFAEGFVAAATALGASTAFVLRRHVLPRALGAVIALAPSLFGQLLLAEAALGFLGLGLPPPTASLGTMIADGQDFIGEAPWLLALPALALAALVLAASAVADACSAKGPGDE
jgi:peptide/nickel transport system permease protein